MYFKTSIGLLLVTIFMTGCVTWTAPTYQLDFDLINEIKDMDVPPMNSGVFSATDSVNSVSARGVGIESPYGKSYALYLKKALEEHLKQSGRWDSSSKIIISGKLIKNELEGGGFGVGESDLTAQFVVEKKGITVYSKTHSAHHEWESSIGGMEAQLRALKNYTIVFNKLLRKFFLDKELILVLKD